MTIDTILSQTAIIPVLEIAELETAAPLARALYEGGLTVAELTLRTSCALEALSAMKGAAPEMVIGMGTIRTKQDIDRSLHAGADFLVSPGATPALLSALADAGAPALPGVATASEAMTAFEAGFRFQKFFPAETAGGAAYLKALAGPLPDIMYCPTGGISANAATTYLALKNVACVGGSWVAPANMIAARNFNAVLANAERAAAMQSARL